MLTKKELNLIRDHAAINLAEMRNPLYWNLNEELSQSERVALAWTEAVSMVTGLKIDVDYQKEQMLESDNDF